MLLLGASRRGAAQLDRYRDLDAGADARLRVQLDAAAHLFDDFFADRQAQTGTLHRDALRAARVR